MKRHGPRGFFLGTSANLVKDLPFAALKMTLYETATSMYLRMQGEVEARQLTPPEAALVGFASGSATGIITCPYVFSFCLFPTPSFDSSHCLAEIL
jgi:hypothetical protein